MNDLRHDLFDDGYYHGAAPEPTSPVVDTATTEADVEAVRRAVDDAALRVFDDHAGEGEGEKPPRRRSGR